MDVTPGRREPDEPPPRLIARLQLPSSSSGETTSQKEDGIPDAQETSDSESDGGLEGAYRETLSKEDATEVKPSFEDGADAEVEDLRRDPEVTQAATDYTDLEEFNATSIVTHSFEQGHLRALADLETGEFLPIPIHQVKKDHPTMVAQHVI